MNIKIIKPINKIFERFFRKNFIPLVLIYFSSDFIIAINLRFYKISVISNKISTKIDKLNDKPPSFWVTRPRTNKWDRMALEIIPNPIIAPIRLVLLKISKIQVNNQCQLADPTKSFNKRISFLLKSITFESFNLFMIKLSVGRDVPIKLAISFWVYGCLIFVLPVFSQQKP